VSASVSVTDSVGSVFASSTARTWKASESCPAASVIALPMTP
jgi:hypothetical protein